ncbi:MAG: flagellin [Oscillospiraceae bacterium]
MGEKAAFKSENLFCFNSVTQHDSLNVSLKGGNLTAYLEGLDEFIGYINDAAKQSDRVKLDELLGEDTKELNDKERLHLAVLNFTLTKGKKLLCRKNSAYLDTEVQIKDGNISIVTTVKEKQEPKIQNKNIVTQEDARFELDNIKKTSKELSSRRADICMLYSRYQNTLKKVQNMEENLSAPLSNIQVEDAAKLFMMYTREQVLAQASIFIMAQGKHQMSDVLSLLR